MRRKWERGNFTTYIIRHLFRVRWKREDVGQGGGGGFPERHLQPKCSSRLVNQLPICKFESRKVIFGGAEGAGEAPRHVLGVDGHAASITW